MLDERHLDRALWRSRRGMLELDLLLVDFARRRYPDLAPADQAAYQGLLVHDDWLVWDWLQARATPADEFARIIGLISTFSARADKHESAS